MKSDIKYLEKKIKKSLVKKQFINWNKESIKFLISIYEYPEYDQLYDFNLNLLDNYINWYKKNSYISNQYSLEKMIDLYCLINSNLYRGIYINYDNFIDNISIENKESTFDIFFYGIVALILITIKYLFSFINNQKIEEKKHIIQLQIPLPDNLINNPLIKYFLGNIII